MAQKQQFTLLFDEDLDTYMRQMFPDVIEFKVLSKSLDARGAPRGKKPSYQYVVDTIKKGEEFTPFHESFKSDKKFKHKPVIIGAGPAGLFAALRFTEYGVAAVVVERGDVADKRMLHISKYWRKGILNPESNVCYGEGGAGLFSDGKLITRIKSPFIKYIMNKFVEFGAPDEVAYLSNPHLGSNKIRKIITRISDYLKTKDCEFHYNKKVIEILTDNNIVKGVKLSSGEEIYTDHIILACGHSAGDMYQHLAAKNVVMEQKDFAVGVRIEHPRVYVDKIQHGKYFDSEILGAAKYRLSHHNKETDKGTYSFCMCPGGYVLSSGTEVDGIVVNGMSNYARNSRWSNSALVVSTQHGRDFLEKDLLAGLDFQHQIEQKAYQISVAKADGRSLPAMTVKEFLTGKLNNEPLPKTSSPSGVFKTDIREIFPDFINEHLKQGLMAFNKKLGGFAYDDALLIAPETRTSAPVTVLRNRLTLESDSHQGLYPAGEGAGYAGGITSAAVDGVKIVEAIINSYN
ncbi:MAG: FAD-dependent oxidoreductase, partial [Halobacteriovoraceae bacterium]|jgi:uncharacterized protein|nr:FAD-dependent oxidoreductase [Halobacteriovoraceae bacterium]